MSDAQRAAEVNALANELLNVVGRRARYDEQLVADALETAFGHRLRYMTDYLYGDVDEFAAMDVNTRISTVVQEADDELEDMPF